MKMTHLELWAGDLTQQRVFYADLLGLPVLASTDARLELQVGATRLVFVQAPDGWPSFYHFAFNIPANQFAGATAWLRERVPLLCDKHGEDEFYSTGWDAHMAYFYDPAGNIGELIARHTLPDAAAPPFTAQSLLNISEIGIVSADVPAMVAQIQAQYSLAVYKAAGDEFAPVGDEHGLFIVVKHQRVWFPDTGKPAVFAPVRAMFENGQGQPVTLAYELLA